MTLVRPRDHTFPILIFFIGILWIEGCAYRSSAGPGAGGQVGNAPHARLQVFAAASLTDVFNALGREFTAANPGAEIAFNFAGSQQLAQQIINGAGADVFASADERQMAAVDRSGLILPGDVEPFAYNRLVVVYPIDNPAAIRSLADLASPGLKVVLAAGEVPAGRYALAVLENASRSGYGEDFPGRVLENVVSYENSVRSVLSKIALGEADAGVVYLTDTLGDQADKVGYLPIPDGLSAQAVYPVAVLQNSQNRTLADAFIAFLHSSTGREILSEYGFNTPDQDGEIEAAD
jgi:molybdate transport system substrate-binding protein